MYKYLCAIILGILIYILLNQYNSFSVGGPIDDLCRRRAYEENRIHDGCTQGLVCTVDQSRNIDSHRLPSGEFDGTCQLPQEDNTWDEFNLEQKNILTILQWREDNWDPGQGNDILQFQNVLGRAQIGQLRENGMSDEFLNNFWMRGDPGAPCRPVHSERPQCDYGECLAHDNTCPILPPRQGPAPEIGHYAGPYCRLDPGGGLGVGSGPCAAAAGGGGGAAGGGGRGGRGRGWAGKVGGRGRSGSGSQKVQREVDTSTSDIDLDKIEVEYDPQEQEIIGDCKAMIDDVRERVDQLKLKYASEGVVVALRYVSYINDGTYGWVCKYASHASYASYKEDTASNYIAIAVKFFKKKTNSEAEIIELINSNTKGLENCNTVRSIIFDYFVESKQEMLRAGLMQLMDGDCLDMFASRTKLGEGETRLKNNEKSINLIFSFFQVIVLNLKCISDVNYVYTDLKLQNCLYKVQLSGNTGFRLGDLDSIKPMDSTNTITTYPTVEATIQDLFSGGPDTDPLFTDFDVFWAIGCTAVEAYVTILEGSEPGSDRYLLVDKLYDLITRSHVEKIAISMKDKGDSDRDIIVKDYFTSITVVLTDLDDNYDIHPKLYLLLYITLRSKEVMDGNTRYDRILEIVT